jgi:hypothetical protein
LKQIVRLVLQTILGVIDPPLSPPSVSYICTEGKFNQKK